MGAKNKLLPQLLPLIPTNFTTYYEPFPFNLTAHQRLYHSLVRAHHRGVQWLYINYDTPTITKLFVDFSIIKVAITTTKNQTHTSISNEIIIKNY